MMVMEDANRINDFICSLLVRRLLPAIFICHIESPIIICAEWALARGDFMLQINLLNPGFRAFYKCFTVPLHLFTIKNVKGNAQRVALWLMVDSPWSTVNRQWSIGNSQ